MATEVGITQHAALSSPENAYWYALDDIKGPWPRAEAVIATDPEYAYYYALDIIKGRWPEAEAVIATNPYWAAEYYACFREEFTEKEQVLWLLKSA